MDRGTINTVIIACGSLVNEINEMAESFPGVEVVYLDQNYHRYPDKLVKVLQEKIDEIAVINGIEKIALGYGLCSNATVGLKAPEQGLYIPAMHDCIAMHLGSNKEYEDTFRKYPGTYYLTSAWIDIKKDPLGLMRNEYKKRVGEEDAKWAINEEIKNYTHIAYVDRDVKDEAYRDKAKENAEYFNKNYIEFKTSNDFFERLVKGPYDTKEFIYFEKNTIVEQKTFLKKIGGIL